MHLGFAEELTESGHLPVAALDERFRDTGDRTTVEPDIVRQIGRTQRGIAFAIGAMTGNAKNIVLCLALVRELVDGRAVRKSQDVLGDFVNPGLAAESGLPGGHCRDSAVQDRGLDVCRITTP